MSDIYLDPMPCLLMLQFDGEEAKFVPNGGAIFTEGQMTLIVENITATVRKKKKAAVLFWQEASNGVIKHYKLEISASD